MPKDSKVLSHLGLRSKVLPKSLTDWSTWVGFCTSSPHKGIKYRLCYLDFFGGGISISHVKLPKDGIVSSYLEFRSNDLHVPLTDLSALVEFCTSSPQQGVKYQLWYFDFFGETLYISHGKMTKDGKVLSHSGFRWKVLHGHSTDISVWVGLCTASSQQGVKYWLCY
jgi:hypothetical protein